MIKFTGGLRTAGINKHTNKRIKQITPVAIAISHHLSVHDSKEEYDKTKDVQMRAIKSSMENKVYSILMKFKFFALSYMLIGPDEMLDKFMITL